MKPWVISLILSIQPSEGANDLKHTPSEIVHTLGVYTQEGSLQKFEEMYYESIPVPTPKMNVIMTEKKLRRFINGQENKEWAILLHKWKEIKDRGNPFDRKGKYHEETFFNTPYNKNP